ncbi:hypothetical protein Trydic_g15882 [Trypoxylus dichotomus]
MHGKQLNRRNSKRFVIGEEVESPEERQEPPAVEENNIPVNLIGRFLRVGSSLTKISPYHHQTSPVFCG